MRLREFGGKRNGKGREGNESNPIFHGLAEEGLGTAFFTVIAIVTITITIIIIMAGYYFLLAIIIVTIITITINFNQDVI